MNKQFDLCYSLDLFDGVNFVFGLVGYSPEEKQDLYHPGCAEEFEFHYLLTFDSVDCVSELEDLAQEIEGLHSKGEDHLQELMVAEYKEQNQPEPEEEY